MKRDILSTVLILLITISHASLSHSKNDTIPFNSGRWEMKARTATIESYKGQQSLLLKGGVAYVKDIEFTNGIIEFDIAFSAERGFMGVVFRLQDTGNYEEFYMRPHQSGNPDATQYTPVFNGLSGWQLYHGEGFSANMSYTFDEWMHVKLVVSGKTAEIYIGENTNPVMYMHELKRQIKIGKVGLSASNFAPAHFANFSVKPMENPPIKSEPRKMEEVEPGTIMSWSISSAFDSETLEEATHLNNSVKKNLSWDDLKCENSGLANIARLRGLADAQNTSFAKIVIASEKEQIKKLNIGFSDRVKVYLNDRILFGGNDRYQSRDYRYLGTIGYFDEVYLPLQKGRNELWIAVSESFGGWGLQGRFNDMKGISVHE